MKDICSGIEKIREVGTAAEPAGGGGGGPQTTWESECCLFTKLNITLPTQWWQGEQGRKKANAIRHCECWRKDLFPPQLNSKLWLEILPAVLPTELDWGYLHFLKCSETQRIF